ncbi:sulfite exporter TauE/SafE family protein [Candidatus Aquiluna sp. IMCC13023]|uniref:sulfite exporter TauE/SafE family protein n=1 Tax=Candidatus Aquiluna sp. IMCC13023 TaxID=1081644 RepID=UPI000590AEE6|nr:sulfite exporter TauE/SafE family protein [Candidatus Aquiluna sp. IMCC13023]
MLAEISYVSMAFAVGVLVGLTGVGAGAIMTPVLVIGFGINPVTAVATDLVFAAVTKTSAAFVHGKAGSVDWVSVRKLWAGSIPGVLLGILAMVAFLGEQIWLILALLACLIFITGISMLRSRGVVSVGGISSRWASLSGGFIGFAVATTSVGAGALGMSVLRRLLGDQNPKRLVATDIVHAIPIALLAGASYSIAGFLDWRLLVLLLLGSVPGAIFGSLLSEKINAVLLRKTLGGVLVLTAAGLTLKLFGVIG